jgi:hypothetical protein
MTHVRLHPVTDVAKQWCDSPKKQTEERIHRIFWIVAGVLILLATIAAFVVIGRGIGSYIPGVAFAGCVILGTFIVTGGIMCFVIASQNYYRFKNRNGQSDDLEHSVALEAAIYLLSRCKFQEVYDYYHMKHGGIEPLVHKGVLTLEQGNQLHSMMEDYYQLSLILEISKKQNPLFVQALQNGEKISKTFDDTQKAIKDLNEQWDSLRQAIAQQQFSPADSIKYT